MRPVGRPRLPGSEKLGEIIAINVSVSMRERLEREAVDAGYRSLSRFIRETRLAPTTQGDKAAQ
jgi:hypothetical protein